MIHQQDAQSQPSKRVKLDQTPENPPQLFCNCFTKQQQHQLLSAISAFQNYTKYASKSIQSLPKQLLKLPQFMELTQRVNKCIQRAKINNQFLDQIVRNYSVYLKEIVSYGHGSNGSQNDIGAGSVLGVFVHVVREWSNLYAENVRPMKTVVEMLGQFMGEFGDGNRRARVFVQGVGMGRVAAQIWEAYGNKIQSMQGCQDRVLHYLCAEYFLSTYKNPTKSHTIYPFIHDFTNKYTTDDAYSGIKIPNFPQSQVDNPNKITNPPALSLNLCTFEPFYQSNSYNNQWNILISYLCNDRVIHVLKWLQIVYKGLVEGGIWVIACYCSWERNVIPLSYGEVREILGKSMFKIVVEKASDEYLINDNGMTKEKLKVHYLVLKK